MDITERTPERQGPIGDSEQQEVLIQDELPSSQEYKEFAERLEELSSKVKETERAVITANGNGTIEAKQELIEIHNKTNHAFHDAKRLFEHVHNQIIENTSAVEFMGDLVILKNDRDKHGQNIVRVERVYSKNGNGNLVKEKQAFDGRLLNAPKPFRDEMFSGPFLVRFDGTLDVEKRYDQIPESA